MLLNSKHEHIVQSETADKIAEVSKENHSKLESTMESTTFHDDYLDAKITAIIIESVFPQCKVLHL